MDLEEKLLEGSLPLPEAVRIVSTWPKRSAKPIAMELCIVT